MRGVTLLAIGSQHYGRFAYNMALSLKYHNPGLKIQLIHDKEAIRGLSTFLFDVLTPIHYEHCHRKSLEPGLAKTHLYDYLVFDETIYFDVDAICIRDITPLFDIKADYATQVFDEVRKDDGVHKNMRWQEAGKIWERFNLKEDAVLPATNTSFQFIRKSKHAEKIFKTAQEAISNSWDANDLALQWGRTKAQPDELYMNIALAKHGFTKVGEPVYFTLPGTSSMGLDSIVKDHYVLGYWGDQSLNAKFLQRLYDRLIGKYSREKLKHHQQYKFHQLIKKKFLLNV